MRELSPEPIPAIREAYIVGGAETKEALDANPKSIEIAKRVAELARVFWISMDTTAVDAAPSDPRNPFLSDTYLDEVTLDMASDYSIKMVFWLPGHISHESYVQNLRKNEVRGNPPRKDIFLIGMTATHGATGEEQYNEGLRFVKENSANLTLAYDYETEKSMVVAPEETTYHESDDLDLTLRGLMEMAYLRSQLTFTRSTVVGGEPVDWNSELVYPTLREVVNFCIDKGAYKPFLGVTAGHFAAKIAKNEFLTSRRKTNFNNLNSTGLVKVVTDGEDKVVAMGGKPSVGGQSQRIVFEEHPERDSIVHFHCPLKEGSDVPVVPQREYECGSHECGQNTSDGLSLVDDGIEAVYLDNHGPNVVFSHEENPKKINEFLMDNFDFTKKTGGYQLNRS